jgi:energy-coupling factor transporter ATP-binding protein EcfA2
MAKTTKKVIAKQRRSDESPEVSPVYFLSLEVENVLCFKDKQVLDLTDKNGNPAQWTVILGDNGVGKTTLLRCLAGLEFEPYGASGEFFPSLFFNASHCASRWNSFDYLVYTNAHLHCEVARVKSLTASSFQEIDTVKFRMTFGQLLSPNHRQLWGDLKTLICYGYGAIRRYGNESIPISGITTSDNSASLFDESSDLINAEEWLLQTDYAWRSATGKIADRLKKQLDQIFHILKHILPDVDDVRIAAVDEENPHPRAEFLTPYGWVHINNLGLGYRTAIAWMVDLAVRLFRRYPNSPDPLAEPAIVLVDEIDLHLHPRWQRTIMDFLTERFPNTQFIVTAHSPLVVQAAQNANIVLLRREGDRVVIDNDPEIIENWRVDQVLTSVFELPSSRPAKLDKWLKDREKLLSKAHLTEADEAKLQTLAKQIGSLPMSDAPEDIEAKDIIHRAAKLLKKAG